MNGRPGPGVDELQSAASVTPEVVQNYLSNAGWHQEESAGRAALWTLVESEEQFEVRVPTDRRLRDFPLRMFDLLHTLAIVEDRDLGSIVVDLTTTNLDTMTFRLLPEGAPGTVPLFNGVDALAGVRELVLSTTYAAMLNRPLLVQGRRPIEVRNFARRVRLGTPQAGSWMISAQLQLPDTGNQQRTETPEPLARQVSLQMHRAVGAALRSAGEALRGHATEPFVRRAESGVSANLCDALAKLGRDGVPYEVRFGWAAQRPVQVGSGRFRFDAPVIAALKRAAEELRNTLPDGRVEVNGTVAKLSRETGDVGTVVITGLARTDYGEAELKVKVRLTPDLYDLAVEAHRRRRVVRLVGLASNGRVETVFEMTTNEN
jgi:hypothetical protein